MKELKAELKRGILHGKIIYVMMMVAILFALGWTENLSQAIEFRENANIVFSSIQHVLYVLYFDRFKAVMIAVLSLLCAGSVYEDISSGFFPVSKTSSRKDRAICDLKDCCEYVSCNNSNDWWNLTFCGFRKTTNAVSR